MRYPFLSCQNMFIPRFERDPESRKHEAPLARRDSTLNDRIYRLKKRIVKRAILRSDMINKNLSRRILKKLDDVAIGADVGLDRLYDDVEGSFVPANKIVMIDTNL